MYKETSKEKEERKMSYGIIIGRDGTDKARYLKYSDFNPL